MKWSEDDTFRFVELYRGDPCTILQICLWNMKSTSYKNKDFRSKAIQAIIQDMKRDGFGATEVIQKIKNLRSTYNQEIQKIKNSQKSGCSLDDIYKLSLKWFDMMNQIMKAGRSDSETRSNLEHSGEQQIDNNQEESTHESVPTAIHEQSTSQSLIHSSSHIHKQSTSQSRPHLSSTQQLTPGTSNSVHPTTNPQPKLRGNKRRLNELSTAVSELRNMNQILGETSNDIPENVVFGNYVSAALAKLPSREFVMAQCEIQNVLTKYRLQAITAQAPAPTSPISGSSLSDYNHSLTQDQDQGNFDILTQAWRISSGDSTNVFE